MKKFVLALVMMLALGATAMAGSHYNPFDDCYKHQAKQELRPGVAQYNYVLMDEQSQPLPGAELLYVGHDNKLFTAVADARGKVHLEFAKPAFVQVVAVRAAGKEYRVIGKDLSDDVSYKDIAKGEVEYYVLQRNASNQAMYIYDAD